MYTGVHVLLLEDAPEVISQIQSLLETRGFQVHVARTLGEALDAMPECAMLIAAPTVQQGQAAASVITEQWLGDRRGPVLLITETVTYEQIAAWLTSGISNVVRKPCKPEDVGTFTSVALRLGGIVLDRYKADQLYQQIKTLDGEVVKLTEKVKKQTRIITALAGLIFLLVAQATPETATWFITKAWPFLVGLL